MLLKILWYIWPLILAVIGFFGLLPKDRDAALKWLNVADAWIIDHAKYPSLFALAIGLILGLLIIPDIWKLTRAQIFKVPNIIITPTHFAGFSAPSSTGHTFNVEHVDLIVCVKNAGELPSTVTDWEMQFETPDGKVFKGLQKYVTTAMDIRLPNRFHFIFPPGKALYQQTAAPIPEGSTVCGAAQFEIDGLPGKAPDMNSVIVLRARDIKGTIYTSRTALKDMGKNLNLIPQLQEFMAPQ